MKIPNPNPCPECEMENMEIVEIDGYKPWWRVCCLDCGYESASQPTIKKAVEWHNQRDSSDRIICPFCQGNHYGSDCPKGSLYSSSR